MKKQNVQMILKLIMDQPGISRIRIAEETHLSASTVTSLVNQLLEKGVIKEEGSAATGGRSRKCLWINEAYGSLAVFEISRRGVYVTWFDLLLNQLGQEILHSSDVTGSQLLADVLNWTEGKENILAIGLLFQDDMKESDFRVMLDTGIRPEEMNLKEAIRMHLHIPVMEEYSTHYTIRQALAESYLTVRSCAYIQLGREIAATLIVNDTAVDVKQDFCASYISQKAGAEEKHDGLKELILTLCMMFPLAMVLIGGREKIFVNAEKLENELSEVMRTPVPKIVVVDEEDSSAMNDLAQQMRSRLLLA